MKLIFIFLFGFFSLTKVFSVDYSKSWCAEEDYLIDRECSLELLEQDYLSNFRVLWKGERVNVPIIFDKNCFPKISLFDACGNEIKTIELSVNLVRNIVGKDKKIFPDIIEPNKNFLQAGTRQIYWISFDVPRNFAESNKLILKLDNKEIASFKVLPLILPKPLDWKFKLDLWQHPEAIARWEGVSLWSDEHFKRMQPLMKRLAEAGQKTITCSIIEEPWKHQTFDHWSSMIKWIKTKNGTWKFDYTFFDKWVEFMISLGIDKQISCYSIISWANSTKYFDESLGKYNQIEITLGKEENNKIWRIFLKDFSKHLREKKWIDKAAIAMDEREDFLVKIAYDLIRECAPDLKIVSAVNAPSKLSNIVDDISPIFDHTKNIRALADERRNLGKTTTFYVCTHPPKPNTFAHSQSSEPHWLAFYSAANGLDGFLRWAYNSWTENPFKDTFHPPRQWPATDCFLVYPGNRTTMRFERLRDGIEDYEKFQILKAAYMKNEGSNEFKMKFREFEQYLHENFTVESGKGNRQNEQVRKARELLDLLSCKFINNE